MTVTVDFAPPRAALWAAAAIIAATCAAAMLGPHFDVGVFRTADSPTIQSRSLRIVNARDFTATVTDARDGSLVLVAQPGLPDGFIWGAVNGLSYGRKLVGGADDAPYDLARREDGKLTLTDTVTGQRVVLNGFGAGNTAAFGRLLERREAAR